jgi:hypothetical protein
MTHPPAQSESSDMPKKKRIVSKAEYFRNLRRRYWLAISALLLLIPGALGTIALVLWILFKVFQSQSLGRALGPSVMIFMFFSGLMWFAVRHLMIKTAIANIKVLRKMDRVAPMKRRDLDQLPAEETLVRASQEPTEGQEKVLLRAAMATEETSSEELLRASQNS